MDRGQWLELKIRRNGGDRMTKKVKAVFTVEAGSGYASDDSDDLFSDVSFTVARERVIFLPL